MRVYLIRHPKPAVAPGVCYGGTDLALAEAVAPCAARLRPLLPPMAPLYSSPLMRCRLLAEALHPTPRIDERLREIDFGHWEMQPWERLERRLLDAWAADPLAFQPPGGEAVAAMRARVRSFLSSLPNEAVLVTHAGVMKLCVLELAGARDWFALHFAYGTVSLIEQGRLVWCNQPDRQGAC